MALKKQKAEKDINRYRYLIKMGNLKLKRMVMTITE